VIRAYSSVRAATDTNNKGHKILFTSEWITQCFHFADIETLSNVNAMPLTAMYAVLRILMELPGNAGRPRNRQISNTTTTHTQQAASGRDEDNTKSPEANCKQMWDNLAVPPGAVPSERYRVLHGVTIATNTEIHMSAQPSECQTHWNIN
jgi:hypothetical protein